MIADKRNAGILRRETFTGLDMNEVAGALRTWLKEAGHPASGLAAMINHTDIENVHVTLATREFWRARPLDLHIAEAFSRDVSADDLCVIMFDTRVAGTIPLSEIEAALDEEEGER